METENSTEILCSGMRALKMLCLPPNLRWEHTEADYKEKISLKLIR